MAVLSEAVEHGIMITGFVFVMMLVIEYVNVQTRGIWQDVLKRGRWGQYFVGALLGAIPGCLGSFVAVTLFSHGIISLGALAATMIATSGDETFIMLAMFPAKALLIIMITFFIGLVGGWLTDKLVKRPYKSGHLQDNVLPLHAKEERSCFPRGEIWRQLRQSSMERALLIVIVLGLLIGILAGKIGPGDWNWVRITLMITTGLALFIVSTVPEHFIKEHLWNHIVKVHIPRVFVWTFGTLLVIGILMKYVDVSGLITKNLLITLLIAVLVGIVPESGPHLIFVTLYFNGTLPFSILLANSIVQDGHGMLPLLAESKKSFIMIKAINVIVGIVAGLALIVMGH